MAGARGSIKVNKRWAEKSACDLAFEKAIELAGVAEAR